jgi:hypothetical protein
MVLSLGLLILSVSPSATSSSCLGTLKTAAMLEQDGSDVVTPVTQSSLDPLMHTSVVTPPVSISLSVIVTPTEKIHTHVSILLLIVTTS